MLSGIVSQIDNFHKGKLFGKSEKFRTRLPVIRRAIIYKNKFILPDPDTLKLLNGQCHNLSDGFRGFIAWNNN